MALFDSVNKFFGVEKSTPRAKTQAEIDDDSRYRNKFRDGPNDPDPKKKKKPKPTKVNSLYLLDAARKIQQHKGSKSGNQ